MQGNICPTCSTSHFPFCPPYLSHDMTPRFPFPPDQSVHGPNFDPYHGSMGTQYPTHEGYGDHRYWHRNPNLGTDSFAYSTSYNGVNREGYTTPHDYNSNKRLRVDEMGSSSYTDEYYHQNGQNSAVRNFTEEDERRLKLIREHGSGSGGMPQGGVNFVPGMSVNYNHGRGGFVQESVAVDRVRPEGVSDVQNNRSGHYVAPVRNGSDRHYSGLHMNDLKQQVPVSHNVNYPNSQTPLRNYGIHDAQKREPINSYWQGSGVQCLEHRSSTSIENHGHIILPPPPYTAERPIKGNQEFYLLGQPSELVPFQEGNPAPVGTKLALASEYNPPSISKQDYSKIPATNNIVVDSLGKMQASQAFSIHPPLPTSPPPPLPMEPPGYVLSDPRTLYMHPGTSPLQFPAPGNSSCVAPSFYPPVPADRPVSQPYLHNRTLLPPSNDYAKESHAIRQASSKHYAREEQHYSSTNFSLDKPKVIDAAHLFKKPHRATRPDHIVVILRGLPGSGKSYLAKMLRDIELENGGSAPRIHSMDDYFMIEVEKVEEVDNTKSSGSVRSKKPITKKVMEYCYEPEMEEAYRTSMLKAFKKTLEEGIFTFVIVDDRNLRVADFAQFWAIAKRSGYEVYLLEAPYKDPVGCAARNVHSFNQTDIQKMAGEWEEAPSLYLQLDTKSLFHGDNLKESGIQEVDMDMEDDNVSDLHERIPEKTQISAEDHATDGHATDVLGSSKEQKRADRDVAEEDRVDGVKELERSKWSDDLDENDDVKKDHVKENINALSGLVLAYRKEGRSVHWGDQASNSGFSIGAAKRANPMSLVIGPGAGYNLKSNPLLEAENMRSPQSSKLKGQTIFQERLRAERESFKVIFDRRRQRIGVLNLENE